MMNHLFNRNFNTLILNELCARHGLNPKNAKLIKADSNLVYDCGDSILRISYSGIRTADDIEVELDWIDFLHRKKVPVVRIIPSLDNRRQERVGDNNDHFTAVRFEKIRGSTISEATWNAAHFQKLGQLTGLIHRTSRAYRYQDHLRYRHWDELVECGYATMLPEDERELQRLNQHLLNEFRAFKRSSEQYGLIHNDIHHENYLLTGPKNQIILFDFEVACRSWYVYEIATALYYACLVNQKRNDVDFERTFLHNFMEGYRTECSIPPIDFKVVLKFMLYRDLFLYGYIRAMWKHRVPPKSITSYLELIDASVAVRRERLGIRSNTDF